MIMLTANRPIQTQVKRDDIVTHYFLRHTFRDVFSSRFKAKLPHTADAALVARSLIFNMLQILISF